MYENLFQPIQIGSTTIPNRIVRTAHSTGHLWVDSGKSLISYHEARARGGVGMSILEIGGVHMSSPSIIPAFADFVMDGYQKLADAMAPHGMKLFQQLWHGGSAAPLNIMGGPLWSASDVPNPQNGLVPVPMTQGMIDEIVEAFAAGARRVLGGGLDGVEIHGAHGYLIGQFLSPLTNKRTDDYGGSVENRTRFLREIIAAMRAEVGPTFPIGVRLSSSEEVEGGLTPDQCAEIALIVEPLVDFIDVSLAGYYKFYRMLAPMDEPLGYELPKSELVTRSLRVPTIVTGRIMTLDHASQIVGSGQADMVSMVRALVADPDLVRKAREGHANEVRPCIGSSQGCLGGLFSPKLGMQPKMGCVVNVAAGIEDMMPSDTPTRATRTKRVVIVGGGAAGMEAARTAALRGHDVTLYEMTSKLGGQVAIAAQAPHRGDYGAITRWLADEMERLGVKVLLRTAADPDLLAEEGADEIIIATGSTPRRDGFQAGEPGRALEGGGLAHVYTSWDVFGFGGRATIGTNALVYDDTGEYEAVCVAEALIEAGAHVTFVTRHGRIGEHVPAPEGTLLPALERLRSSDFTCVTGSFIERISPDEVQIGVLGGTKSTTYGADTVVMVGYNHPNRELADAMVAAGGRTHLVGDAAGGIGLQKAIKEGHMAARLL
ncbi:MAG: FAD-dependent oxidoreductase [Acidimicrobiales bacterium]